ncbi:Predicted metal-dependent peptidase [Cupriavidus sp. YR651]|uniref:vWA domain-containing protein n=1 Tax=Cupriavidus sp. YR651 TaxID=1855315 RepID=UPI00087F8383|nr:VWA-like domain-containing protein [Cupriavidus sp. YR651]SDD58726.1 Predicted metal-dependent peptidase [Cupriavidus sp. YR651]
MHARLVKQRAALVLSQPFFGALALRLKLVEDASCETLWVDGVSLGYNLAYIETVDDLELRGLLAHEVLHVANGHCWRMGARDQDRWNRACDYAVNPLVLNAQFKLPQGVLLDGRYLGRSAEEIYAMLRQDESSQSPDESGSTAAAGQSQGQGSQPPAQQGGQPSQQPGGGQPQSGSQPPPPQPNGCGEVRQYTGPDKPGVESEWRVAVNQAAKAAKMRGALPGDLEHMVEAAQRPSVDWRAVLHRFATEAARADYSWRVPNRRYAHLGLYLPSLHSEAVGDAVFVRDSSGSVFDETQRQFAAEIIAVHQQLQPERLIVIDCDTRVTQVQMFARDEVVDLAPLKGGGGTSFKPPFAWLDKEGLQPAFLVYLTDLLGAFPAQAASYPVLWASVTALDRIAAPPFGETVEVIV